MLISNLYDICSCKGNTYIKSDEGGYSAALDALLF